MYETGISTWDKICLLSWKNWSVLWSQRNQTLLSLITPSLAVIILILFRISVGTQHVGVTKYEPIDLEKQWIETISRLKVKKQMLPKEEQSTTSSLFPKIVLAFSPNESQYANLIQKASSDYLANIAVQGYSSNKEMREAMFKEHHLAGVHFHTDLDEESTEYSLVFPSELRFYNDSFLNDNWQTNQLYTFQKKQTLPNFDADGGHLGYIREGFASLQNAIAMSIIKIAWNDKYENTDVPTIGMQRFPDSEYVFDALLTSVDFSLPFVILVGYLYPCLSLTKYVVTEKELRIDKYLKLLGVSHNTIFFSWFMKGFMKILFASIPVSILLKVHWSLGYGICSRSSWTALLFVLISYGMASVSFCFIISSLTKEPISAVIMLGALWIFTFLPFMVASLPNSYDVVWSLICSNATMGFIFEEIILLEQVKEGLQWYTMWNKLKPTARLSVGDAIIVLIILCVIYALIGLYLEKSIDKIVKIFIKWYTALFHIKNIYEKESVTSKSSRRTKIIEIDHEYKQIGIELLGISKVSRGTYILKNITFTANEGDITVIMGNNGSGKTTLLSIIAGILAPTTGHVYIADSNRDIAMYGGLDMGLSLRHSFLFPDLTVMDQIIFYSRLKGLTGQLLKAEVKKYLSAVSLENMANMLTRDLSPSLQCSLSVCCALCGNSKYVFLDEPSTDIDQTARRKLWDLLLSEKANRTIVFTTHSFYEAEVLADRIVILSNGELMCCGSSFFLNNMYAKGYRLECIRTENCDSDQITQLINKYIPNTTPQSDIGTEISYTISEEHIEIIPKLLHDLEASLSELKISSCSIRETGIEDIFLLMSSEDYSEDGRTRHSDIMNGYTFHAEDYSNLSFLKKYDTHKGFQLIIKQFWALIFKRLYISRNYTKTTVMQLCLPGLITYLTILLSNPNYGRKELPEMSFRLTQYPGSSTILDIDRKQPPTMSDFNATQFKRSYSELCQSAGITHKLETTSHLTFSEYILLNRNVGDFDHKILIGATFEPSNIIAWFNNFPLHVVPLSLNMVHNGIIRILKDPDASITVFHEPLPYSIAFDSQFVVDQQHFGEYLALNLSYTIAIMYSTCFIYLIYESGTRFKLLQYISGVRPCALLCANMFYDIFMSTFVSMFVFCVLISFADGTMYRVQSAVSFSYMLIIFGFCITPFYYVLSKLFAKHIAGYIVLCTLNANSVAIYAAVSSACTRSSHLWFINDYRWLFRILPHYSLCECLSHIFKAEGYSKMSANQGYFITFISVNLDKCLEYPSCCRDTDSYFCCIHKQIFPALMYLLATGVISVILLFALEYRKNIKTFLGCRIPLDNISLAKQSFEKRFDAHESVIKEELRVNNLKESQYKSKPLVMSHVSKLYGKKVAVSRLSLVMERCECIGLLGINGSGKSTIFKMITGDEDMSSGRAYVDGFSLTKPVLGRIGYCPQGVFLPRFLTCCQLMELICHLRGIPKKHIPDICICLAKVLGIINYLNKPIAMVSQGNKRRLNTAISFIGCPSLICMDVCGSGIDAIGRRQLLNITWRMLRQGSAVLVNMISLKECERFCTRIGHIGYGNLLCVDTVPNFANMYMKTYVLRVKTRFSSSILPDDDDEKESLTLPNPFLKVISFIEEEFPNSVLRHQRGCLLEFLIPVENISLATIFKKITRNAFTLNMDTFTVKRSPLSIPFIEMVERSSKLYGTSIDSEANKSI